MESKQRIPHFFDVSHSLKTRVTEGLAWRIAPLVRRFDKYLGAGGVRRLARARDRWLHQLSNADVRDAVTQAVGKCRSCLMVHSSLSACGYHTGGAASALDAMTAAAETLALPTHTYCYPNSTAETGPLYRPQETLSVVGAITNEFWRRPGVSRSIHPSHSLAALGPRREVLLDGHQRCDTPCGPGTPYERLVAWDSAVLMFGATMNTYTLFHTAEDAARCPYLYYADPVRVQAEDEAGAVHAFLMRRQDMSVKRRFQAMDGVLENEGLLHRTRLGRGELLFIPSAQSVHIFVTDQLARDPFYLVDANSRREVEARCK